MNMDILHRFITSPGQRDRLYGVSVGIVTNNQDPEGMGRVKVKLPWLTEDDESYWARVLTPMAGNHRGLYFLPEVDDEVLVAFEHGLADFPYVLGALWNGKDKTPESNADGHNNMRAIHSRSGHIIRLDDTEGQGKIEIIDRSGNNRLTINSADNTLTISADSDITIQSSSGKLKLHANGIEIISQAGVTIEASTDMDVKSSAQLNLKGSLVNIN
jgi:uncharacterized protein involved in type VI secretion and phage assembly